MSTVAAPVTVTRIPDPGERVGTVSLPLVGLLVAGLTTWIASTVLYLTTGFPWWAVVPINAVCSYVLFTVAHDAAHHSASQHTWLNNTLGRLAVPLFAPHASYPVWRFIHMQHHRFTNHDDGKDPDHFTHAGPTWQLPLRWVVIDLWYMVFYLPRMAKRPRKEQAEEVVVLGAFVALLVACAVTGNLLSLAVVLLIPCRVSVLFLAWAFDYLPHSGLHHKPTEDKLKSTRNRVGSERLLSPALLFQNYHLVHHLHPVVPFHKYVQVWRKQEDTYLAGEPALSTVRGRPITAEEYRQLREMAEHH